MSDYPYSIPGQGEAGLKCGEISYVYRCVDCGHIHPLPYNCASVTCPVCYTYWASKASSRSSDILHGVAAAYLEALEDERVSLISLDPSVPNMGYNVMSRRLRDPRHIVFSPPKEFYFDFYTLDGARTAFKSIISKYLTRFLGGLFVFHPYRIRSSLQAAISDIIDGVDYTSKWDVIHKDGLYLGSFTEYVTFSPHFHVLGFGSLPKSDYFHSVTGGWVYYTVGSRSLSVLTTTSGLVDEVQKTVAYLLTHCACVLNPETGRVRDCVSYFGICARRNVVRVIKDGKHVVRRVYRCEVHCENCGGNMVLSDSSSGLPFVDHEGKFHYREERIVFHRYIMKKYGCD